MKKTIYLLLAITGISLASCNGDDKKTNSEATSTIEITDAQQDFLGITNKDKLSAASKRA